MLINLTKKVNCQNHENHECKLRKLMMELLYLFYIVCLQHRQKGVVFIQSNHFRRPTMKWEQPSATDLRFGFEVTMYIANR